MSGNAGRGRPPGSRNRLTAETLALVSDGKTPVAFALEIMKDESKDMDLRLNAARIAAPYLHSKPQPEGRIVSVELPDNINSPEGLTQVHTNVLRAVAGGEISLDEARELSAILDAQGRLIALNDHEARLRAIEEQGQRG